MRVYLLAAQAQPLCVVLVTHTAERPRRIVCDHQCRRRAAHQASSTSLQQSNTYTRVAAAVGHCPWDIGADSAGLVSASRSTPDSWGLRQVSLWWMLIAQRLQRTALQHCCTSHWLCECRPRQLQLHWAAGQGRGGAALQACVWLVQSWQAVHTHSSYVPSSPEGSFATKPIVWADSTARCACCHPLLGCVVGLRQQGCHWLVCNCVTTRQEAETMLLVACLSAVQCPSRGCSCCELLHWPSLWGVHGERHTRGRVCARWLQHWWCACWSQPSTLSIGKTVVVGCKPQRTSEEKPSGLCHLQHRNVGIERSHQQHCYLRGGLLRNQAVRVPCRAVRHCSCHGWQNHSLGVGFWCWSVALVP